MTTKTDTAPEAVACDLTAEEMLDTLTGFEEIAISQAFQHTVADLATSDPFQLARALVFVHVRRASEIATPAAFKQVQGMSNRSIREYFVPNAEAAPGAPKTEPGKDSSSEG